MCGIIAQYNPSGVNKDLLQFSLGTLKHRGPEKSNLWVSGQVALGHNLLSFSKGGEHPVSNEEGTIRASVNGEFYDYESLRCDLESKGHRFRSNIDSELLVHLYEEYGVSCLKYLNGEFAFVLWDEREQTLFSARDRFGIKPLVYYIEGGCISLASEAKALIPIMKNSVGWNRVALAQILTHQYTGGKETIFEGINQIPSAHYLLFKGEEVTFKRYYDFPKNEIIGNKEIVPQILERLERAVERRLHSDAAFSLSGGIDSSSLVTLGSQIRGQNVPAFSLSFDHCKYDESKMANEFKNEIGADLTLVSVRRTDLLADLEKAVTESEGITINGQMVAKRKLARAIRNSGYKAVISAEGADEAFLGYAHIALDYGAHQDQEGIQSGVMLPNEEYTSMNFKPNWLHEWPSFFKAKFQFCEKLTSLLNSDLSQLLTKDITSKMLEGYKCLMPPHKQSAYIWTKLSLSNYILRGLGDGTEMPHSLEGRVPYLDHDLFSFAWSIPSNLKLKNGETKWILRQALKEKLPNKIVKRPKHPLLAPPMIFDRNSLNSVTEILLSTGSTLFNQSTMESWLKEIDPENEQNTKSIDPIIHMLLSLSFLEKNYKLNF